MSHLTTSPPAMLLGACVGLAAGLCAPWLARSTTHRAGRDEERHTVPALGWLTAILGAGFGALLGARFGLGARLPAYLYLVGLAPVLGAADATTKQLPNRVLLPAYPITAVLLTFAAWRADEASGLWRSIASGTVLYVLFLAVALAGATGSLGFGDVKLAGVLGLFLGFLGWSTVWLGMMLGFGLAAACVLARRLLQPTLNSRSLPLGPALLLGALIAVAVS